MLKSTKGLPTHSKKAYFENITHPDKIPGPFSHLFKHVYKPFVDLKIVGHNTRDNRVNNLRMSHHTKLLTFLGSKLTHDLSAKD